MDHWSIGGAVGLAIHLTMIAIEDIRTFRIRNVMSLPLIAAGLVFAVFQSEQPLAMHVLGAAIGYVSLAVVGEAYFRWRGMEGLGLGDAKLFAAAGAWLGAWALPFVLLAASLLGLVQAVALLVVAGSRQGGRNEAMAFGPHLAAGFWLVWVFGAPGLVPVWR